MTTTQRNNTLILADHDHDRDLSASHVGSWLGFDPAHEAAKVTTPMLIVHRTGPARPLRLAR
jgi:hypothetical protein